MFTKSERHRMTLYQLKIIYALLFLLILNSASLALAEQVHPYKTVFEDLEIPHDSAGNCRLNGEELNKTLIPRFGSSDPMYEARGHWACHNLKNQLAKSYRPTCLPFLSDIKALRFRESQEVELTTWNYIFYLTTRFLIEPDDKNQFNYVVKVYLSPELGLPNEALEKLKLKIKVAEKIWNDRNPFVFRFKLRILSSPKGAHYTIKVLNKESLVRATEWSAQISDKIIAHEVGHLFGLYDEYNLGIRMQMFLHDLVGSKATSYSHSGELKCFLPSLMCDPEITGSSPEKYHYYLIGKMLYCKDDI